MEVERTISERQFGLDWLRIMAFAILILYHIGMFFVPWGWHVKTADPIQWLEWPMMAVNPWRLSLLFVISGIVSRSLIAKLSSPGAFASSRSLRLMIPLVAGMAFFVAPQAWVELSDQGKYSEGFIYFWLHDYAEFGASRGTPLPTWNHLWFVAYLWVYSMILAIVASLPSRHRVALQECFDGLFSGWRLYILPICLIFVAREALFPVFGETHALVDDPYAHVIYSFAFFFGVGLARSATMWTAIIKNWKLLLMAAGIGVALTLGFKLLSVDSAGTDVARAASRAMLAWTAILGLLGMAQLKLHYDGPVRRYLTEAIFPYYIAHQTIIVVVGYLLKQMAVGPTAEFISILVATLIGCALTYEVGRRIRFLRPVIGLKALPTTKYKPSAQLQASVEP